MSYHIEGQYDAERGVVLLEATLREDTARGRHAHFHRRTIKVADEDEAHEMLIQFASLYPSEHLPQGTVRCPWCSTKSAAILHPAKRAL